MLSLYSSGVCRDVARLKYRRKIGVCRGGGAYEWIYGKCTADPLSLCHKQDIIPAKLKIVSWCTPDWHAYQTKPSQPTQFSTFSQRLTVCLSRIETKTKKENKTINTASTSYTYPVATRPYHWNISANRLNIFFQLNYVSRDLMTSKPRCILVVEIFLVN